MLSIIKFYKSPPSMQSRMHQNNDIGTWIPRNLYREIPGRRQSQLGMARIASISGSSDKQFGNCLQPALRVSLWSLWALRTSSLFSFSELEAITRDHPAWLRLQQTAFPLAGIMTKYFIVSRPHCHWVVSLGGNLIVSKGFAIWWTQAPSRLLPDVVVGMFLYVTSQS